MARKTKAQIAKETREALGYNETRVNDSRDDSVEGERKVASTTIRTDYSMTSLQPIDVTGQSIHVNVTHTIIDRRAGTTVVHEIMGEKPNLEVIADHMKYEGVRDAVATYILERRISNVLAGVIPVLTFKSGEKVVIRSAVLAALANSINDVNVLGVLTEFVVSLLHSAGIIEESVAVTSAVAYPTETVTPEALTLDLIAQTAVRTAETLSVQFDVSGRMSREAFAEAFAEALIPIGYSLISSTDIQHIFDDTVKAIHARLLISDPFTTVGLIEEKWLNHPTVQELSSNYIFVEAARLLPVGTSITTKNSMFSLDRDAGMALASLKASKRYSIVTAEEYKSTYGKMTLVDSVGAPCFFYGWRAGKMEKAAQNVCVFEDATMPNIAKNIVPGSVAADKFIQSAMPNGEAASVDYHINRLALMRQHLLETRDPHYKAGSLIGQTFVFGDDGQSFSQELTCLLADRIYLQRGDDESLNWVYVVRTSWKNFYHSDFHINLIGDLFYTTEVGVALMLMNDFAPTRAVEARAQLLSEKALYTRVINLDEDRLKSPRTRISFSVTLGGTRYGGAILPREVGLTDLPASSQFVVPVFNDQISETINLIQKTTSELIKFAAGSSIEVEGEKVPFQDEAIIAYLRQMQLGGVVALAREVSVQYRQTVDSLIRIKALDKMSTADAIQARGVLSQQQFMGYADLVALLLIFETNGLQSDFIARALKSDSLIPALLQQGSDRKQDK